jgi:hypothetical protein
LVFYLVLPVGGVTAGKDKIYIGGEDKVIILNIDGTRLREITTDLDNFNLLYNERNDQLLFTSKHASIYNEQFCKVIVKCYTTWSVNTIMFT